MTIPKAYQEIIYFIASGTSPKAVIDFRPSQAVERRVKELLRKERISINRFLHSNQMP